MACKSEHDVPVGVNRTWVKYVEEGVFPDTSRSFSVMRCNHCSNAPCVTICPVTALYKRDDGIVDFDSDRCIGCKACTQACPYDALYIDPNTNTAAKCNYCTHRIEQNMEPACVVICPEQAIISGDLQDRDSIISKTLQEVKFTVRKAEKGTGPKVFYINANQSSLDHSQTTKEATYSWSSQDTGVGHNSKKGSPDQPSLGNDSKRVLDQPDKGVLWGWEVPSYLMTKGVATGIYLVHLILWFMGYRDLNLLYVVVLTSFIFLAATGLLLLKDMDRPDRFLNVLFRPQWKSWLVKGAYLIMGYFIFLGLNLLAIHSENETLLSGIMIITGLFAIMTGLYTAFLFRQAKGRDYWQNPLLPFHMLSHVVMLGSTFLILLGSVNLLFLDGYISLFNITGPDRIIYLVLMIATAISLVLQITEPLIKHETRDAQLAAVLIYKGKFKLQYWIGSVIIGCIIPLALLTLAEGEALMILPFLIIIGVGISNHLMVRAPQLIPMS